MRATVLVEKRVRRLFLSKIQVVDAILLFRKRLDGLEAEKQKRLVGKASHTLRKNLGSINNASIGLFVGHSGLTFYKYGIELHYFHRVLCALNFSVKTSSFGSGDVGESGSIIDLSLSCPVPISSRATELLTVNTFAKTLHREYTTT